MDLINEYKRDLEKMNGIVGRNVPTYEQLLWYYSTASFMLEDKIEDKNLIFDVSGFAKSWCDRLWQYKDEEDEYYHLLYQSYLLEAPYMFDSYLMYLEKNREIEEKFYEPKRKQLNKHGIITSMQDLEDDKLDRLTISMPPGTQKTTALKFFCSWITGKYPKDYSLFFSHSGDITRKFYDGILDILTSSEYTWGEIFPDCKVTNTNAKLEEININKYKPYSNIQCSSVGSKNSGKIRTNRYLYCDDLIGGIEEALNPALLEKIWRIYGVDLKQRKLNEQVKEIMIMTRWASLDPIGRLKLAYGDDPRNRFIAVPDIDPITGKSNFDYEYNGMSVEFFNDQAKTMDEISYKCLYKNEPIDREGQLFPEPKLRRYLNLPVEKPEEITGQVDCKAKGTDFMVMPVLEKHGEDYYMTDVVCNKGADFEVQYEDLANMIVNSCMQSCEFESNMGGDRVAEEVNKRVTVKGWICNITTMPTETNKEARIFQCSNWIMQHIIFKDKSLYSPQSPYGIFMAQLVTYSITGKNVNDDCPDVLSNFAIRKTKGNKGATAEAIHNPFRR